MRTSNYEKLSNALLSILTSATLAILGFIWHLNNSVVGVEAKDIERDNKISNVQVTIDKMRLEQEADRENTIKQGAKLDEITYWIQNKKNTK